MATEFVKALNADGRPRGLWIVTGAIPGLVGFLIVVVTSERGDPIPDAHEMEFVLQHELEGRSAFAEMSDFASLRLGMPVMSMLIAAEPGVSAISMAREILQVKFD